MNTSIGLQKVDINVAKLAQNRNMIFGFMLFAALVAFEIFNFSTTEFALADVLGDVTFSGIKWATILSLAFCGIDFAGVARLFTPSDGQEEPTETWYLFGSWILAAGMNATLTWWGVSIVISNHVSQGSIIMSGDTIQKVVPVFVAIMVWLIRIMIIGSFSAAGDHFFNTKQDAVSHRRTSNLGYNGSQAPAQASAVRTSNNDARRNQSRVGFKTNSPANEPTYHSVDGYQTNS